MKDIEHCYYWWHRVLGVIVLNVPGIHNYHCRINGQTQLSKCRAIKLKTIVPMHSLFRVIKF